MEYCGGGSVADLMNVTEEPLEEYQIAYICREALKVRFSTSKLPSNILLAEKCRLLVIGLQYWYLSACVCIKKILASLSQM